MIVLDTDIVTLFSYGSNETLRTRIEGVGENDVLAVAVITRMEILQGRYASILKAANLQELRTAMERFRQSEALLNSFHRLDVDDAATDHFATLTKQKPKAKKGKMKRGDMLVACIVLANDALLVTRNVGDYQMVAGLRVENWAD